MAKLNRPLDLLPGLRVPVYLMAEQEFCEMKVDIEIRHPNIEEKFRAHPRLRGHVNGMDLGRDFHEAVAAPAESISPKALRQLISTRQPLTLLESSLEGHFGGLALIGRPDALYFDGAGNAWVVEHKVREKRRTMPSDDAQLRLYGYLLKQDERFIVKRLSLVCVVTGRRAAAMLAELPESGRAELAQRVCTPPPKPSHGHLRWDEHSVPGLGATWLQSAVFRYDAAKVKSELDFLSGYWLGDRKVQPTTNPRKCAACPVNAIGLCRVAQAKYGDRIARSRPR